MENINCFAYLTVEVLGYHGMMAIKTAVFKGCIKHKKIMLAVNASL
jgi:hypothetical protein